MAENRAVLLGNWREIVLNLKKISNIYKLKEKVQKNTQLSFWWKTKSSSYEICLRGLHLCCVLLRTRAAHRLSLQHLAAVPKPNIAELVLSVFFFCPQSWFLQRSEHIFPGKTPACLTRSIDYCKYSKLNFFTSGVGVASWSSHMSATR